jgi:hypothetical protein
MNDNIKTNLKIGDLIFDTSELGLAAFLKVSGLEIKIMFRKDKKTIFSFKDTPERKKLVDDYFTGKAKVEPLAFRSTMRDLKNYTFNK